MQPIILRLDPQTRYLLEQVALVTGHSRADMVAEAVRLYINSRVEELVDKGFLIPSRPEAESDDPMRDGVKIIV